MLDRLHDRPEPPQSCDRCGGLFHVKQLEVYGGKRLCRRCHPGRPKKAQEYPYRVNRRVFLMGAAGVIGAFAMPKWLRPLRGDAYRDLQMPLVLPQFQDPLAGYGLQLHRFGAAMTVSEEVVRRQRLAVFERQIGKIGRQLASDQTNLALEVLLNGPGNG